MAHHTESASEHHPEDPEEHEQGKRIVVQIFEERRLQQIDESSGEKSANVAISDETRYQDRGVPAAKGLATISRWFMAPSCAARPPGLRTLLVGAAESKSVWASIGR